MAPRRLLREHILDDAFSSQFRQCCLICRDLDRLTEHQTSLHSVSGGDWMVHKQLNVIEMQQRSLITCPSKLVAGDILIVPCFSMFQILLTMDHSSSRPHIHLSDAHLSMLV